MLFNNLNNPSTDIELINERLECVDLFYNNVDLVTKLKRLLKECHDIERALQRISLSRASPRDLVHVASTLNISNKIKKILKQELTENENLSSKQKDIFLNWNSQFGDHKDLCDVVFSAIVDNPPQQIKEGFVSKGFSSKLDDLIDIRDNSTKHIVSLETKYKKSTSISKIKP